VVVVEVDGKIVSDFEGKKLRAKATRSSRYQRQDPLVRGVPQPLQNPHRKAETV
jgi:hypothetical protein